MDDGMNAILLPGKIQVIEVPVEECEEVHQTILSTSDIDWANIPLTIGPNVETNSNEEGAVDEVEEESIDGPQLECKLLSTENVGDTEYVYIEIEEKLETNVVQTSAPCLLFPDGTVRSLDDVVLLEDDEENASDKSKKQRKFNCKFDGCGRAYSSQYHLKVHERNHTGEKPYKCPYSDCIKEFNRDFSLKAHVRTHTGERPYLCPYFCGKAFKTSGDLQKHTRTHTGERPFLCPVEGCDKSFTTSNTCRIHMRRHTGEKPYICQEEGCGKAFSSSTNFKSHMRIHSGEQPYVCSFEGCEKSFTEYSSLYKHRLVHSHEKRYKCGYCDKAYRQMTSLTTHKRAVHGVFMAEDGSEVVLERTMEAAKEDEEDSLKNVTSDLSSSPVHSIVFKSVDINDDDYGAVYEVV